MKQHKLSDCICMIQRALNGLTEATESMNLKEISAKEEALNAIHKIDCILQARKGLREIQEKLLKIM